MQATKIITVAAGKGGVGKTTLAYEDAAELEAWLVDLDWDAGGATAAWGYTPGPRSRLLDAFESGREPRALHADRRPALVPSHPDLAAATIPHDLVTDCLTEWAKTIPYEWMVVDTHPGANSLTDGAMAAADLVVVPVVLGNRELDALEGMLRVFAAYPLLLIPNMVNPAGVRRWLPRLERLAKTADVPVGPIVSEYRWMPRRLRRSALVLEPNPGVSVAAAAGEYRAVAQEIKDRLR